MTAKPLSDLVEELQSDTAGEERAKLAREESKSLDPKSAGIAGRLVDAVLTLASEDPKAKKFKIGEDCFDKISADFKSLPMQKRSAVMRAIGGELGDAIADAWDHMSDFQYGVSVYSMAFRSPSTIDANFDRLFAWLKKIIIVLYKFPPGLVTPEWLAVHGSGIKDKSRSWVTAMLGILGEGDSPQDAFGSLLGSVLAGEGDACDTRENVFETLSLIANGEHPVGEINSYMFRALWRSGQYRCYEVLTGLITTAAAEDGDEIGLVIGLIAQSARESGPIAMGIALESVLSHRLLTHESLATAIGSWIKVPLEEKPQSQRYEIVRQLLESLQNLEQLKMDLLKADCISGSDASLILFAQGYEDAVRVPKLAKQLFPRLSPDGKPEFATALAGIDMPPGVDVDGEVWLTLLMDDDLSVSAPLVVNSKRAPKCDPVKLFSALEKFQKNLPAEKYCDLPLIAGDYGSTPTDAYRKMVEFAGEIADDLTLENLFKILDWGVSGGRGVPKAITSRLDELDLHDVSVRKKVVQAMTGKFWIADRMAPRLIKSGFCDSDLQWLMPFLQQDRPNETIQDAVLALPVEQQISLLIDPMLNDDAKKNRVFGCRYMRWICERENPPEWIAEKAEAALSDGIKDVRVAALGVLLKLSELGISQGLTAKAITRLSEKKRLSVQETSRIESIRKTLPKNLLRDLQKEKEKNTPQKPKSTSLVTEPIPVVVPPQKRPPATPDLALIGECIRGISDLIERNKSLATTVSDFHKRLNGPLHKVSLGDIVTKGRYWRGDSGINEEFPHREIWEQWYQDPAQASIRDAGIPAMIFAFAIPNEIQLDDDNKVVNDRSCLNPDATSLRAFWFWDESLGEPPEHIMNAMSIVHWLALKNPTEEAARIFMDRAESLVASLPTSYWEGLADPGATQCRNTWSKDVDQVLGRLSARVTNFAAKLGEDELQSMMQRAVTLWRFIDRPAKDVPRCPIPTLLLTLAFGNNVAQKEDFFDNWNAASIGSSSLAQATFLEFRFRKNHPAGARREEYQQIVDRYTEQTIDILLAKKSDATEDAIKIGTQLRSVRGSDYLFKLLKAVGKKKLKRLKSLDQTKVLDLICQLIITTIPGPDETLSAFSDKVAESIEAKWLTKERLIELAVYAPQWALWIEKAIDTPGLKDAAVWFYIWTYSLADQSGEKEAFVDFNLTHVSEDPERFPAIAEAMPSEYPDQLLAKRSGIDRRQTINDSWHIDAQWFARAKAGVDTKVWAQLMGMVPLLNPPKPAAILLEIIAAMSGELEVADLRKRIETEEPNADSVQLAALIPVADVSDGKARLLDLASRVRLFQLHARLAKRLKVAKRRTALTANMNARKLLANAAGIEDVNRLDWYAMADLNERIDAVSPLTIDDAVLSLVVQPNGQPAIFVESDGKKRKTIPKAIAKNEDVVELKALEKELKADAKQVLKSFESAMINEVKFAAEEIINFLSNPLLGPPLKGLVLGCGEKFGTPEVADEKLHLCDFSGEKFEVGVSDQLLIVHAVDLFSAGCLADWREAFNDRVQAIEQLQRDIFRPTKQELADGRITRFADYQIRGNQARKIFQSMGWETEQNFGPCWFGKTGPDGTHASVRLDFAKVEPSETFEYSWFSVTEVEFYKAGDITIDNVDPKFLSETIRQVNQVVSVAEPKE